MTPFDLQKKLDEARDFLLANDFAQAAPRYEKLTRHQPSAAVIWTEYGNAAAGLRDFKLADRAWQKALALEPRNAELAGMIGHQYQASRQPDKARACFSQAAAADPHGINPRISIAVLLEKITASTKPAPPSRNASRLTRATTRPATFPPSLIVAKANSRTPTAA